MRCVVIGGGISGLVAAYRITQLRPDISVTLLEASDRIGGSIRTEHVDGLVIDRGPEAMLSDKVEVMQLVRELGLVDHTIGTSTSNRGAYVVHRGALARIPSGFSVLGTSDLRALIRSPILSLRGRVRAALEPWLPWSARGTADRSIKSVIESRYGSEVYERIAQPIASGVYGGDGSRLSAVDALSSHMEGASRLRSITRAMQERAASQLEHATGARYGLFINFDQGMQALTDGLGTRLGDRIELGAQVVAMRRSSSGVRAWQLEVRRGDQTTIEEADVVVVALPSQLAAELLEPSDPELGSLMRAIEHGSATIVTFAFEVDRVARPLDAFGFVVPAIESGNIAASTWLSVKWPGRAPANLALVRVYLREGAACGKSDAELVACARDGFEAVVGACGDPRLTRVDRFAGSMPRYYIGHGSRVAAIIRRVATHAGLHVIGNAYVGVGIPDAIRYAECVSRAVATSESLAPHEL